LSLTEEPCIFQYYIYLAKKKGSLDETSINEAQELWDKLCSFFSIENKGPRLIEAIQESNKKIYFDKNVKRLITLKTDNDLAFAEQILAHDVIVLCFVHNTQKYLKTNTPEKYWEKLLGKIASTNELSYIYDSGTVLQTITDDPQRVAELVQKNLPKYKNEPWSSCVLDFGKLWRFGPKNQYLLTINKEHEESANSFLGYSFAYIITLLSKIQNHYSLAVKLYEQITEEEKQVNEFRNKLEELMKLDDIAALKENRNKLSIISNETTENLTYLRDCGVNIQNNIINLKAVVEDLKIIDEDNIFSNNLELFEEHVQNINSWATVSESALLRINKAIDDMRDTLKEQIEKLEFKMEPEIKTEKIILTSDTKISEKQVSLEWGNFYISNDIEFEKNVNIFDQILQLNNPGNKLENSTIYWLSSTSCDFCLPPSLAKITHVITQFFKTHEKSVLLLDGLEYLITNNEFNKVLKLIDNIKELVSMHNSILLLPVSFSAFSGKEISLIMKNMCDITAAKINLESLSN